MMKFGHMLAWFESSLLSPHLDSMSLDSTPERCGLRLREENTRIYKTFSPKRLRLSQAVPVSDIGAGDNAVWVPVGACVGAARQKETGRPCVERPSVWAQAQMHNLGTFFSLFLKAPASAQGGKIE